MPLPVVFLLASVAVCRKPNVSTPIFHRSSMLSCRKVCVLSPANATSVPLNYGKNCWRCVLSMVRLFLAQASVSINPPLVCLILDKVHSDPRQHQPQQPHHPRGFPIASHRLSNRWHPP